MKYNLLKIEYKNGSYTIESKIVDYICIEEIELKDPSTITCKGSIPKVYEPLSTSIFTNQSLFRRTSKENEADMVLLNLFKIKRDHQSCKVMNYVNGDFFNKIRKLQLYKTIGIYNDSYKCITDNSYELRTICDCLKINLSDYRGNEAYFSKPKSIEFNPNSNNLVDTFDFYEYITKGLSKFTIEMADQMIKALEHHNDNEFAFLFHALCNSNIDESIDSIVKILYYHGYTFTSACKRDSKLWEKFKVFSGILQKGTWMEYSTYRESDMGVLYDKRNIHTDKQLLDDVIKRITLKAIEFSYNAITNFASSLDKEYIKDFFKKNIIYSDEYFEQSHQDA